MKIRPELEYRKNFVAALIERTVDAHPPDLDAIAARRFRVYRNNVHGALIGALADAYPVVQRLVGERFFAAMAREFFIAEPARAPSLVLYGAGFPDFIERFEPADSVAYLVDVAHLERARLESLHAVDAAMLDVTSLPGDGRQLLDARFELHHALRLVASEHPIVTIWLANQTNEAAASIQARSEYALVTRPGYEVQTKQMDVPAGIFTRSLMHGATVHSAYTSAFAVSEKFDAGAALSCLLEAGAFMHVTIE